MIKLVGVAFEPFHPAVKTYRHIQQLLVEGVVLPQRWGDYSPYRLFQQFCLHTLVCFESEEPKIAILQDFFTIFSQQSPFIRAPLKMHQVVPCLTNQDFYRLYTKALQVETAISEAAVFIRLNEAQLFPRLLSLLETLLGHWQDLVQWLWSFVLVHSYDTEGTILPQAKRTLWDDKAVAKAATGQQSDVFLEDSVSM